MLRFLILITFIGLCSFGQSQDQAPKWLAKLADPKVSITEKGLFADSLLMHYRKRNPDSAIFFARKIYDLGILDGDTSATDYALAHLGSLKRITGDYDSALYFYNQALASFKYRDYPDGVASIYNNIATVYKTMGRYDLAIKKYHEALEILKLSNNLNARSNTYSNFAELYFRLENFKKARLYWQLAEKDYIADNKSYELTHCYRGYSKLYIEEGNLLAAENSIDSALKLDYKNHVKIFLLEDYLILMKLGNLTKNFNSFRQFSDSASFYLAISNNVLSQVIYNEQMGIYFDALQNFKESRAYYNLCLTKVDVEEVPEIRLRILKKLLHAELKLNQLDKASKIYSEIAELEDRVAKIRADRITQEMSASYELQDKEEKIALLEESSLTAQKLIRKERELKEKSEQLVLYLGIGILIILLFFTYIIRTNRKLNQTQKALKKNVEEKEFLFRELNHRVKNNLHIVNSFIGIEMHGRSSEVLDILKVCERRIHSLGLMHDMLYQGEIDGDVELKLYFEKLTAFILSTLDNHQTKIHLDISENLILKSHKVVLVGLIVNELITNALKYAKAPSRDLEIELKVVRNHNQWHFSVADNGIGLAADFNPQSPNSLGMKMAYGLTHQLNGTFTFQNTNPGSVLMFSFSAT